MHQLAEFLGRFAPEAIEKRPLLVVTDHISTGWIHDPTRRESEGVCFRVVVHKATFVGPLARSSRYLVNANWIETSPWNRTNRTRSSINPTTSALASSL